MNRQFIQEIFDKIENDLPEFKKVALFANQFDKMNDGTEKAINFPAIFISFPNDVEYQDGTSGVQRTGEFIVRLLIGSKLMTDKEILTIFDLKQKVYDNFNGFQTSVSSTFRRLAERTDEDRNGFYVFEQDYIVNLIDTKTYVNNKRILHQINTLDVDGELIIDPNTVQTIRTDKEIS